MQNIIKANQVNGNLVIRRIIKLINKYKNNVKKLIDMRNPSYELNSCLCQLLYVKYNACNLFPSNHAPELS